MSIINLTVPAINTKKKRIACGDIFIRYDEDVDDYELWILTRNKFKVVLSSLSNGNCWSDPVWVSLTTNISLEEFTQITANQVKSFIYVGELDINIKNL